MSDRKLMLNDPAAYYMQLGREQERERIIKLLESDPEDIIPSGGGLRAGYEIAIELIKGKQQ